MKGEAGRKDRLPHLLATISVGIKKTGSVSLRRSVVWPVFG